MQTNDLIQQLKSELKPVKPQMSPRAFAISLFGLATFIVSVIVYSQGLRSDFTEMIFSTGLNLRLLFATALLVSSVSLLGYISNPGRKETSLLLKSVPTIFLLMLGFYLSHLFFMTDDAIQSGMATWGLKNCSVTSLTAGFAFGIIGFLMIRRRLVLQPMLTSLALASGAAAVGSMAVDLYCAYENHSHVLSYHLLVPLIVFIGFFGFAKFLFRKA